MPRTQPILPSEHSPNAHTPLLPQNENGAPYTSFPKHDLPSISRKLYTSHFLSTWNSRVFEFGSVLYLAAIFPGTLMPMSVYALVRGLAAIIFAPAVGSYIDTRNRLRVVRASIVFQRLAVAASCVVFYVLLKNIPLPHGGKIGMLVLVTFFACTEKLCSIMNLVSVEKDWVVTIAESNEETLKILNAQMRRIDLLCKLLGPLSIALIDGYSTEVAIIVNFAMNVISIGIEYIAIVRIYYDVPKLQESKTNTNTNTKIVSELPGPESSILHNPSEHTWMKTSLSFIRKFIQDFTFYTHHRAFLPSIAGAILYLTVLSFSSQMITYLLSAGYDSIQIGIARTLSVAFELLATWTAPWLMGQIGVIRAGLWFSSGQVIMLIAGIAVFWIFARNPFVSASGLVGGTILSRLGLRGFDLCVQIIVQEEVEAEKRGAFSSVEAAWQNAFELLSYASTIVFFRPEQFKWPSLISVVAVMSASVAYTIFVYLRRGHLLHLEALTSFLTERKGKQIEHNTGIDRVISGSDV